MRRLVLLLLTGGGLSILGWAIWLSSRPAAGAAPDGKVVEGRPADRGVRGADLRDFGGAPDGSDTTPALDRAIAWCQERRLHHLDIPAGHYTFKSAPRPIDFGLFLRGDGMKATVLEKEFDGGSFFTFTGASGDYGGGMQDLSLLARPGRAPGNAIVLSATARRAPHYTEFRSLWISGVADPKGGRSGVWANVFMIDGREAVGRLQGIRGVCIENPRFFNGDVSTLYAHNAVELVVRGGGFYQGAGAGCRIVITGGGTLGKDDSDGVFIATNLNGELNLTNCQKVLFDGTMGELNAADTAWYCRITGVCSGRRNNALRNSYVHLVP